MTIIDRTISSKPTRVAKGLDVSFYMLPGSGRLEAVWSPRPPRRPIPRVVWRNYKRARQAYLEKVSEEIQGQVACVDLGNLDNQEDKPLHKPPKFSNPGG